MNINSIRIIQTKKYDGNKLNNSEKEILYKFLDDNLRK